MAITNTKQITKINAKTKLLEFNDRLQWNDFSKERGVAKSIVHGKFSRINLAMVDWTKGKGDKAVVTTHNVTPDVIKMIAELVMMNMTSEFTKTDKYTKKTGFFEQKIDQYKKDDKGLSPVSILNIRYQEQMDSPWTITLENGNGVAETSDIGGIKIKSGSYKTTGSVTMYLSKADMIKKMAEVRDHILAFETSHMKDMLAKRTEFEKKLSESNK